MWRAFNLANCGWGDINPGEGATLNEKNSQIVKKALKAFLDNEGRIDGTSMRGHWFPEIKADVFYCN